MKPNKNNNQKYTAQKYTAPVESKITLYFYSLLAMLALFFFVQINPSVAQNAIQSNEKDKEELDWNIGKTESKELTKEEKELAKQTALDWEKWDEENPAESISTINNTERVKKVNEIKSPTEVLRNALIGTWEGFYGGSKAYISFKENKTVVINTSIFSNIPSASGRDHTQLYYEIDASKSPYRLIFYNRDKEIKGVFRIQDNNQIIICHNFKNDEQPQEIDNKYTIMNFHKLEPELVQEEKAN